MRNLESLALEFKEYPMKEFKRLEGLRPLANNIKAFNLYVFYSKSAGSIGGGKLFRTFQKEHLDGWKERKGLRIGFNDEVLM